MLSYIIAARLSSLGDLKIIKIIKNENKNQNDIY